MIALSLGMRWPQQSGNSLVVNRNWPLYFCKDERKSKYISLISGKFHDENINVTDTHIARVYWSLLLKRYYHRRDALFFAIPWMCKYIRWGVAIFNLANTAAVFHTLSFMYVFLSNGLADGFFLSFFFLPTLSNTESFTFSYILYTYTRSLEILSKYEVWIKYMQPTYML